MTSANSSSGEPPLKPARPPLLIHALIPVVALIGLIAWNLLAFEGDAHIPLILASGVAALVGVSLGIPWKTMEEGILHGIQIGMKAVLILCVIGVLVATWIASGVVPLLIYYGLQLLAPSIFLVAACLICCVVSLATGSSWTTAGTVGVALIGVAKGLEVPLPMAAGAIVSGAYFGDKMSPLSDSTNLAPAVAGSELFEHIRHMTHTTLPGLGIALVIYALLGLKGFEGEPEAGAIVSILTTLKTSFHLTPLLLLPPACVIFMVKMKLDALPALCLAALLGGGFAIGIQGLAFGDLIRMAHYGYTSETGHAAVDELLTRGGLDSMMFTVSLILCALTFGGIMERTGLLAVLARTILSWARSTGSLVATTVATCAGMNVLAPDQYLSIIVPGRMYRTAYQERGLHMKNLSRTLEDAGTLSSPLVAWNTCGAYMAKTLMVSPLAYAPYAVLNWATPLIAIALAYLGWGIARSTSSSASKEG